MSIINNVYKNDKFQILKIREKRKRGWIKLSVYFTVNDNDPDSGDYQLSLANRLCEEYSEHIGWEKDQHEAYLEYFNNLKMVDKKTGKDILAMNDADYDEDYPDDDSEMFREVEFKSDVPNPQKRFMTYNFSSMCTKTRAGYYVFSEYFVNSNAVRGIIKDIKKIQAGKNLKIRSTEDGHFFRCLESLQNFWD